jgi:cation transport ATPase
VFYSLIALSVLLCSVLLAATMEIQHRILLPHGPRLFRAVPCLPTPQRDDWQHWVYVALVVLVTACPCALVISTPVTSVCGLARAARQVRVRARGGWTAERLGG